MLRKYLLFAAVILAALAFFHFHHAGSVAVLAVFLTGVLTGVVLAVNDPIQDARTREELDAEWSTLVGKYNAAKARLTRYV